MFKLTQELFILHEPLGCGDRGGESDEVETAAAPFQKIVNAVLFVDSDFHRCFGPRLAFQ